MFCKRHNSRPAFMTRLSFAAAILALAAFCQPLSAQNYRGGSLARPYPASPGLRPITHPSLPTGQTAALRTLNSQSQRLQPVEWKLPEGVRVEIAQPGLYQGAHDNKFALQVGQVYRFRITGVATYPGQALYPTLEMIGRINPPEGREWDFPIEIEVPVRDLALALRGNFVTRVIFVENSENAANVDAGETNENLVYDVPDGIDPVVAASVRGRALAILRIGSREPDGDPSATDPFFFGLPRVGFSPVEVPVDGEGQAQLSATPNLVDAVRDTVEKVQERVEQLAAPEEPATR